MALREAAEQARAGGGISSAAEDARSRAGVSAAKDAAARHAAARCSTCITIHFVIAVKTLQAHAAVMKRSAKPMQEVMFV